MPIRFQATVRDIAISGLAVVDHPNGTTYFAKGAWLGDYCEFEIPFENYPEYHQILLIEVLKKSPDRTDAPCPHQGFTLGTCGGCPWMIANYESQLKIKHKNILYSLQRAQIDLKIAQVLPIQSAPQILGYRNRAQLRTDGKKIGFISTHSRVLAPIKDCLVLTDKNRNTLQGLIQKLPNNDWLPGEGYEYSYIEIDENMNASEAVPNKRRPFRQGNSQQNEFMQTWIQQQLQNLNKEYSILELFCGSGNFTQTISQMGFAKVVAIECNERSITSLKSLNLNNVHAEALDLFRPSAWNYLRKISNHPEILILDPPRGGFQKISGLLKTLRSVEEIIYISCDLESFTQDAKILEKQNFRMTSIQGLDQFPHTSHIEILSRFKYQR